MKKHLVVASFDGPWLDTGVGRGGFGWWLGSSTGGGWKEPHSHSGCRPGKLRHVGNGAQTLLAGDAIERPWNRFQAPVGNGFSTIRADPIVLLVYPIQGVGN